MQEVEVKETHLLSMALLTQNPSGVPRKESLGLDLGTASLPGPLTTMKTYPHHLHSPRLSLWVREQLQKLEGDEQPCGKEELAHILVCRQWQLLSSGNFADSMRVGHDVTGTLAWPAQHGVQGS
jgi:hypothetical protein